MRDLTSYDLVDLAASVNGGFVWIMSEDYYNWLRFHGHKDDNGNPLYVGPGLSGYGTLLGHKIAVVDFDHFGIAKI